MKKRLVCMAFVLSILLTSCSGTRDFHIKGDIDYYYEEGCRLSCFETPLNFIYSPDFVNKIEPLEGEFNYFYKDGDILKTGELFSKYEIAILTLSYTPESYLQAKEDLFDNSNYVSAMPDYAYNGFEFYKKESGSIEYIFYVNAFNDVKNHIVILGFHTGPGKNICADVPEEEWPEFLRTYFGEYYDFDA